MHTSALAWSVLDGFIVGDTVNLVTTGAIGTLRPRTLQRVSVVVSGRRSAVRKPSIMPTPRR